MAIKDQCCCCKKYNTNGGFCAENQLCPIYDGTSCSMYQTKGINLRKDSIISDSGVTAQANNMPTPIQQQNPNNTQPQQSAKTGLARMMSCKGRIGRGEYALSYFAICIYNVISSLLMEPEEPSGVACVFVLLTFVPICWFLYAQGAKRCHDLGNSGWWQLVPFYILWLLFAKGEDMVNNYGPVPNK